MAVVEVTGNGWTSYFVISPVVRFELESVTTYRLVHLSKTENGGRFVVHLYQARHEPVLVYCMVLFLRKRRQGEILCDLPSVSRGTKGVRSMK